MAKLTDYHLFHRLWTKAVGSPDYCKPEWKALEKMILALEEREKIIELLEGNRCVG